MPVVYQPFQAAVVLLGHAHGTVPSELSTDEAPHRDRCLRVAMRPSPTVWGSALAIFNPDYEIQLP